MAFTVSGVEETLVFDLSLPTAKLYIANINKDKEIFAAILGSLSKSRVSAEILETTNLELALAQHAFDDIHGGVVRRLLCRFFRTTEAEKTKKADVSEERPVEEEKSCPISHQTLRDRVDRLKEVQGDLNQRVAEKKENGPTGEKKTATKRKLEEQEDKPAKIQKTEEQGDEEEPHRINSRYILCHLFLSDHDMEKRQATALAEKLQQLPAVPSKHDTAPLLEGLTASVLELAEQKIGKEMNRVDAVWWALLSRDFGRLDRKWSCGIRTIYKGYVAIREARKQRERAQA